MSEGRDPRRVLPSLDHLLSTAGGEGLTASFGRSAAADALRQVLADLRCDLGSGSTPDGSVTDERILADARRLLTLHARPGLRPVLNGTGVVLHTGLGRAPLARVALDNLLSVARGYSNLEHDLARNVRGDRTEHCSRRIRKLTGSEDALVVNNAAAAVALAVNCLADRRQVIVARGELVEIGGSFRVPEIVRAAGGELVEVGTTNRTRPGDYRDAIGPQTGLLLKVHPSNYRIEGFTEETTLSDLVSIGREAGVPVAYDLGSGLLLPERLPGLSAGPDPTASAAAGADLVIWSGDKLFGGPQAGIIHGRVEWVSRLRQSPLLRAFRIDKLTLAALEATLALYDDPERAMGEVPALARLSESADSVRARAEEARESLDTSARERVRVVRLTSLVGGGTCPGVELPSAGWQLTGSAAWLDAALRAADPPLVGRIVDEAFVVDFRTLAPGEDASAAAVIGRVLATSELDGAGSAKRG